MTMTFFSKYDAASSSLGTFLNDQTAFSSIAVVQGENNARLKALEELRHEFACKQELNHCSGQE
jgi:hypothetical protein